MVNVDPYIVSDPRETLFVYSDLMEAITAAKEIADSCNRIVEVRKKGVLVLTVFPSGDKIKL